MTFSQFDFDPRLEAGIAAEGYVQPTPIQQAAIPKVLVGRDVLGVAQTGTGKTAAFMLPILQNLLDGPRGKIRALVLAPTRELAEQIRQATFTLGRKTRIRPTSIYGGIPKRVQVGRLQHGVEIVVACPGRLLDLHGDGEIDLSHVETLVLDEADRMCDMGFLPDIRRILAELPKRRQNLFFSATMPREIRTLADSILVDPAVVTIGKPAPPATVSQALYPVPEELKGAMLTAILKQNGRERTLVFTRTKYRARNLATVLSRKGHRVAALQGNMPQNKRQAAIDGFRRGQYDVLVATDIASRGIDVVGIDTVVNYDMPDTLDAYTHRVGRTGRAHNKGEALNLVSLMDTSLVREIQEQRGSPLEQRVVPDFDYGDFTPQLLVRPRWRPNNGSKRQRHRRYGGGGRARRRN